MPEDVRKMEPLQTEQDSTSRKVPVIGADLTRLITKVAVIAAVAVVAIVAAFMVTAKVLKPMMASNPDSEQAQAGIDAQEERSETVPGREGEGDGELLFEIDQIIVNPASTLGSRFLSCSVALEIESRDDLRAFESREVKIRDALITILSARTVDELADARMREPLRRQILARINKLTEPVKAKAVYFKDFVLQ